MSVGGKGLLGVNQCGLLCTRFFACFPFAVASWAQSSLTSFLQPALIYTKCTCIYSIRATPDLHKSMVHLRTTAHCRSQSRRISNPDCRTNVFLWLPIVTRKLYRKLALSSPFCSGFAKSTLKTRLIIICYESHYSQVMRSIKITVLAWNRIWVNTNYVKLAQQ